MVAVVAVAKEPVELVVEQLVQIARLVEQTNLQPVEHNLLVEPVAVTKTERSVLPALVQTDHSAKVVPVVIVTAPVVVVVVTTVVVAVVVTILVTATTTTLVVPVVQVI